MSQIGQLDAARSLAQDRVEHVDLLLKFNSIRVRVDSIECARLAAENALRQAA